MMYIVSYLIVIKRDVLQTSPTPAILFILPLLVITWTLIQISYTILLTMDIQIMSNEYLNLMNMITLYQTEKIPLFGQLFCTELSKRSGHL